MNSLHLLIFLVIYDYDSVVIYQYFSMKFEVYELLPSSFGYQWTIYCVNHTYCRLVIFALKLITRCLALTLLVNFAAGTFWIFIEFF